MSKYSIGKKYNKLTIISDPFVRGSDKYVTCLCDCGNETITRTTYLSNNHSKSCGCMKGGVKHGLYKTEEYKSWQRLSKHKANGIYVCSRWSDFSVFLNDIGKKSTNKQVLIRIDITKGFYKENVKWDSPLERVLNRKKSKNTTSKFKGVIWDKERKRWRAEIKIGNKKKYLGRFDTEEVAYKAYSEAFNDYYGFDVRHGKSKKEANNA